jgi:cytochrome d ubiquinol oxidase subunit II
VPLQSDGYFFLPLWTDWTVGPQPGILDWYTALAGIVAVVALALHGANYAALKTTGELNNRARRAAAVLWPALVALTALSLAATLSIRPDLLDNYRSAPVLFVIPVLVAVALFAMRRMISQANERGAFTASCSYLICMLLGAAAAVYPNLLSSTTSPALSITVYNAHSGEHSLAIGLIWWSFGIALAIAYFVFVYRMFRGKLSPGSGGYGH